MPDVTPAAVPAAADELSAALDRIKADHASANPFDVNANDPVPRLVAAVERVMDLHRGITDGDYPESLPVCEEDGEWAPCPTVRAITAALTGKEVQQ